MADNNLILTIVAQQGYIHNTLEKGDYSAQNELLFSAISETYVPLLNMLSTLKSEGIEFKLGLVLSAPLCTLLEDPQVQKQYIDWLDRRIKLGEEQLERNKDNAELCTEIQQCLKQAQKDKIDFAEVYGQNLLSQFREFAREGYLELMATSATYAFLPHYADLTEVLNAQIETGLYAQKHFFGEAGEGFYLPYLGWAKGMEKVLRSYGINYTIVDARSFLFSKDPADTGIFAPLRTSNSLVLFAQDPDTESQLNGDEAYRTNELYRSQALDIGFDLPQEQLSSFLGKDNVRTQTHYKYWNNSADEETEAEDREWYNSDEAMAQAQQDAMSFYLDKSSKLLKAREYLDGKDPVLVCTIPAENLGQNWHEGMYWLEQVIRIVAMKREIKLSNCKDLIQNQFTLPKINPYPCAARGTGYGEDLLDSSNSWMLRYIRKASERMIDLTERFPSETGLKARLLNLGAKEVLLAESGDWPEMLTENRLPEVASESFKQNIISFTTVFDSLASNSVSTEWLTNLEKKHSVFPWINYRIFSRKK